MTFETMIKIAESILDSTNKGEYVTVFLTERETIYTETLIFEENKEYCVISDMILNNETKISKIVCVFKNQENVTRLERPSDCNCRLIYKINPDNIHAEIMVNGFENNIICTLKQYLDYPAK